MGSAPSRSVEVVHFHVCQPVCAQCNHQPPFAGPLSASYSSRRSAVLGSRSLDSRTGGGRTRTHASGASGSRADSRRNTDSRATGQSGRRSITQHGERDMGHSGRSTTQHGDRTPGQSKRRSSSRHGSRQSSHDGNQGARPICNIGSAGSTSFWHWDEPPAAGGEGTGRWGPVEYDTRISGDNRKAS
jgi:hypothetical protein